MDRLTGELRDVQTGGDPVFALGQDEENLVHKSALHDAIDPGLFNMAELDCFYDDDRAALWTYMRPAERPSFTPPMLDDFNTWQRLIAKDFGPGKVPLRYLVLGSRAPGVFCFGGDLALFQKLIRDQDREGLEKYGFACVEILHRNMQTLDLPMLTIGLVQGAALGGGFEALLSFDYLVAERDATFGLPEVLFGLFPGMGAHAILTRKVGAALADRIITSNQTYTAEELYEMGLVHVLAEPGEGLEACRDFIKKSERRHPGLVGARRAARLVNPLMLDELCEIVKLWADTALQLSESDLKMMNRLTSAQRRVAEAA
ncbi:crotonase/enoyl-CoA hydratase family protein [Paraurantiacibacter namhicola]|uniref:2,3-dehydroadipyl-CoA hydratase n=1 Tax=Paraurantiacibacter namhicola TaxID=645517 RepID=A0A1C7D9G8_9SPHN|nr:crotonase/enoyl-CoA hydratase family protein [Paraurantiacibacter namhicola]ANU08130.1 2,3-dehydroadipyl-CoA hydratase [Paraurantiacibacter namhicola]